ncbi:MAG: hypothetical protein Tp1125DCM00d2C21254131_52 [Prokaryotic dsDNA virus sp.]|nr:MAG: hypothetical protein Tp1125DCM00d2C21254131_52 [Prokaryotic dsDNA virus sp.]|tara:strand:+ start:1115 stop:1558 length:444 start_codon:yes stop_codon:yes gene_type:complete
MGLGSILGDLIKPVTDIVGKAVVDKDQKRELDFKVKELIDEADKRFHNEVIAQIEVNKEEAKHPSVFVAGWRPGIGWVGALSLFMYYPVQIAVQLWNDGVVSMDLGDLMVILGGILGIGGYRTYEKIKGVDSKKVGYKKPEYLEGIY